MSSVTIETFLKLVLSHGYMNTISSELLLPHPVGQATPSNEVQRECCIAGGCCNDTETVTEKMNNITTNVEEREQVSAVDYSARDDKFVVR